jgi:hypothetical protein
MVSRYLGEDAFLGSHKGGDYAHHRCSSCEEVVSFPVVPRHCGLFRRNESHVKLQAKNKFHPVWEARYLVVCDPSAFPRALVALVALAKAMGATWSSLAKEVWTAIHSDVWK